MILAGDFNCTNIDWATHSVGSTGKDQEAQQSLVDVTSDHLLTQIQQTPTQGPSVLDLVFTSNPTLVKTSVSVPDHDIVVSDFDAKPQIHHQKACKYYRSGMANWKKLKDDMHNAANIIEEDKTAGKDIDKLWTTFKNLLTTSKEANLPTFLLRPSCTLPWLTAPLRRLIKQKKSMFQRASVKNNWSDFRQFQKFCGRELQRAEWQYINRTTQAGLANNNTKPFWCCIRLRKQDTSGVAPLREDGQLHRDSQTKADILLKLFKSVLTTATLYQPREAHKPYQTHPCRYPWSSQLLHQLNPNKAPGPDNIPSQVHTRKVTGIHHQIITQSHWHLYAANSSST